MRKRDMSVSFIAHDYQLALNDGQQQSINWPLWHTKTAAAAESASCINSLNACEITNQTNIIMQQQQQQQQQECIQINQSLHYSTLIETNNNFSSIMKNKFEDQQLHQQQQQQLLLSANHFEPLSQLAADYLIKPMHSIETNLNYYFYDVWSETGDERANKLPFIGSGPWKLFYATLVYLYLIKWLLPRFMKSKKPFELNWLIRIYNLFMVLSNSWAFYHGCRILSFGLKCFGCETIDHSDYSSQAIELLHYGWLFFLSRLIEWLDTIFFVLRKKDKQVTKLHVFHHSFVPLISWTYLKYHPGYTVAFFPYVNSFVHSIMYTYYFLATFGTNLQPYLWWKRYLTSLQIAQFVLILIQLASIPLTGNETCKYPRGFLYVAFAGAILFLWLFYTYYIDTYTKVNDNSSSTSSQLQFNISKSFEINKKLDKNGAKRILINQHDENNMQQQQKLQSQKSKKQTNLIFRINDTKKKEDHHYYHHHAKQREGTSRALADSIDNAIGSFCDLETNDEQLKLDHMLKQKIV